MTHRLHCLLYPDFQLLDMAGPVSAFELAGRHAPQGYHIELLSLHGGPVRSSSGVTVDTRPADAAGPADTLLAVGGDGIDAALADGRLTALLQRAAVATPRIASVCSGAFLLAAAGLLDGRRATTHWQRSADFARRFPRVELQPDRIHVHDGPVWTAAGISAGIDLALALIAEDHGEGVARRVAQQLVVYYRRPGGQSQFSRLLELSPGEGRFAPLLDYIRSHLDQPLDVDTLAARACMSPRHFARLFAAEVGTPPARAVERLRVEAASAALDSGSASLQQVARQCGFGDAERMRRAFLRLKGVPPSALKQRRA